MNIIKKERLIALTLIFAILLTVYVVALYRLQIIEGEKYYEESRNNMVTTSTVTAARGNILDRYGRVLVTNKSCYDLTINTDELFPSDDSVDSNAVILKLVDMVRDYGDDYIDDLPITTSPPFEFEDMSEQDQARLDAYMEQNDVPENASAVEVLSSMRTRYDIDSNYTAEEARIIAGVRYSINVRYLINTSDYVFVKDADMKLIATLRENNIEGINIKESYVREYSTSAAAHVLGYTGAMSDSDYAKYSEQGYSADATVGKDGAELAFEKYLHGTNGTVRTTSSSDGTVISKEYTTEPEPGNNVYLTIDIALQEAAELALENGVASIQAKIDAKKEQQIASGTYTEKQDQIDGAAVVVVNVKTGEPLAIANWPTYDPAELLENYNEILEAANTPLYNRALLGGYAPGSTFKPCTAIAALTEGVINTGTSIECRGQYTRYEAYGYAPYCWIYTQNNQKLSHGYLNVTGAIQNSCNIFFYSAGHDLGIDKMDKYAALFGLGESTGIELPESTGNMANPENHEEISGEEWTIGQTMQAAIGQSDSVFTPLQLAEYCATIANNGVRYSASVLKSVRSYSYGENIYERENEVLNTIDSAQYNWDAVKEGMRLVGKSTLSSYTMTSVAAKTGTAQKGETIANDAIFICYAPFDDPEIAMAIVVQKGSAGSNCAVIAQEILEAYFSLKSATDVTDVEGELLK
jgi:penicillin-binding protein 2